MKFTKRSLGQNFLIDKNIIKKIVDLTNIKNRNIIEIGPGKALSGIVKRTVKNAKSFSINTITDMKNLENEFKK